MLSIIPVQGQPTLQRAWVDRRSFDRGFDIEFDSATLSDSHIPP